MKIRAACKAGHSIIIDPDEDPYWRLTLQRWCMEHDPHRDLEAKQTSDGRWRRRRIRPKVQP